MLPGIPLLIIITRSRTHSTKCQNRDVLRVSYSKSDVGIISILVDPLLLASLTRMALQTVSFGMVADSPPT